MGTEEINSITVYRSKKEWAKLAALGCTEKSGTLGHKIQINHKYGYSFLVHLTFKVNFLCQESFKYY